MPSSSATPSTQPSSSSAKSKRQSVLLTCLMSSFLPITDRRWTREQLLKSLEVRLHIFFWLPLSILYIYYARYSQICPHLYHPPYPHRHQLLAPPHRPPASSGSWILLQILTLSSVSRLPPPRIDNLNTISTPCTLSNLITNPQQWKHPQYLTESLFQRHMPTHAQNHAKMEKCVRSLP